MTYHPRVSVFWWLRRRSYTAFVLRELSSVFVAWFVVYLLLLVRAVGAGSARYQAFLSWAASPWMVALNLVALAFVLLHAVTWFQLAAQAVAVRVRGRRVPPVWIVGANVTLWALVSVAAAWILLGG